MNAKQKTIRRWIYRFSIILIISSVLFSTIAHAAWDGSGSTSGSGGNYVTGSYLLNASTVEAAHGYRFFA